jgi:hypothetical protein
MLPDNRRHARWAKLNEELIATGFNVTMNGISTELTPG